MTTLPNTEPTLQDLANKLNKSLADNDRFKAELDKFNDRFTNYQKATQWVVQLAFTLIASATLTIAITAVLRK